MVSIIAWHLHPTAINHSARRITNFPRGSILSCQFVECGETLEEEKTIVWCGDSFLFEIVLVSGQL